MSDTNFAQSPEQNMIQWTIEWFWNKQKSGKNDTIKQLLLAIKEADNSFTLYTPSAIYTKIKGSADVIKGFKSISVDQNTFKATLKKIYDLRSEYNGSGKCVDDSIAALCKDSSKVVNFLKTVYDNSALKAEVKIKDLLGIKLASNPTQFDTALSDTALSSTSEDIANKIANKIAIALGILKSDGENADGVKFKSGDGTYEPNKSDIAKNNSGFKELSNLKKKKEAIKAYLSSKYKKINNAGDDFETDTVQISGNKISELFNKQVDDVLKADKIKLEDEDISTFFTESSGTFTPTDLGKALLGDSEAGKIAAVIKLYNDSHTSGKIDTAATIKDVYTKFEQFAKDFTKYQDISTKAQEYFKASGIDVGDLSAVTEENVKKSNTELFKIYEFINSLIKNIPNNPTGVLNNDGNKFTKFIDDMPNQAPTIKKAANAYFKIIYKACGTGPFTEEPPAIEFTSGAPRSNDHTKKCLIQANTIAYKVLNIDECGNDKPLEQCFTKLGEMDLIGIYSDINDMKLDPSNVHPSDGILPNVHLDL